MMIHNDSHCEEIRSELQRTGHVWPKKTAAALKLSSEAPQCWTPMVLKRLAL
jgi:hypothetical protein